MTPCHPVPSSSRTRRSFSRKSPSPFYFWAPGTILLWVFKSSSLRSRARYLFGCSPRSANSAVPLSVAWQRTLSSPPHFLHLCSWQLPSSPRTHGRCWEDCVGGAGHEVRDLPQGPDVGGVVPLLHLLLDEAFQLLPERLKQAPSRWSPPWVSCGRLRTSLPRAHSDPLGQLGQGHTWDPWASEDIGNSTGTSGAPPNCCLGRCPLVCSLCPMGNNPDSRSFLGLSDIQNVPPTSKPPPPLAIRHGSVSL